jgi:hypothetical protein
MKFHELENLLDLEFDGDVTDFRLHGKELLNWGAETEEEYNQAAEKIDAISYSGNGWSVYAWYDVSGFDYWMNQQEEQNYINITVAFDSDEIDGNEIPNIQKALDSAYEDAYAISENYDYIPNRMEYKSGGSVKSHYNTGRSWHLDRQKYNKSEDWEKPLNKRGASKRSNVKSGLKGKSKKYMYVPNYMIRGAEINNKGKVSDIDGANILDGIYVKGGTKFANGGGVADSYSIQGVTLKKGDKFQVGDDSSIYTFHGIIKNNRFGFDEIVASSDWEGKIKPIWRVDTMEGNKLYIKKFANGGGIEDIESEINNLYSKSNFINDDFNWKTKLLEMLQDESVDAYDIYQSLNENQKEEVLKELYEMDNDMGSYGDGDIETSRENLEILLEGAKNGKKYSELPRNYANGGKVDISEFSVSDKKLFQCLISVLNSVHDLVGNDNVIDRFIDTHNNKYVFLIKNNESNTELQEQLSYNIMVMSECRDYLDYSGVRFENNILTIPVKIDLKFANGGGINSGRDLLFKSKQPHEQKYKRKREWKEYKKEGWLDSIFANGGGVDNILPKGELTNKNNLLLKYEKVGDNYEFYIYKPITKEISGYNKTNYVCENLNCPMKMKYNQFINYLYAEMYIDDKKYANGGGISEDIYAISAVRESDKQVDIISTHKTYKAASNKLDKMFKNGEANFDVYETWRVRKLSESNEYKNGGSVNKYKYIPNYMVESVEVERNGKTTEIDGDKILDGLYVKGKTKFDNGGGVGNIRDFDNKMALINLDMIHEYAVKLDEIVTDESELEEWVKMKLTRVEQNVADVKHSLVGWDKFEGGGMIFKKQLLHIVTYAKDLINMIKAGSKLMSWQEAKLAISADNIDGIYHHINYLYKKQADKFDKYIGEKYENGGGVSEWKRGTSVKFKTRKEAEKNLDLKKNQNESDIEFKNLRVEKVEGNELNRGWVVVFDFKRKYANGGNVGRDLLFKSKQPHEQRYKRKREWKEYKKEGWFGDWFKDGGSVWVSPHVIAMHDYIIKSYGFLLPNEREAGFDTFTYSDFAEKLKSNYDIKNPRNKEVYDYLNHLGSISMFSGNVSDMKKVEERMSTADVKYANGGGVEETKSFTGYLGEVISINMVETALGRKINPWQDDVITLDGVKYKKVYLRPEYKQI